MMITVEEADKIILSQQRDYGVESVPFEKALGMVLAEDITADRDLPPFNRVTMDGIALKYSAVTGGRKDFAIKTTQAAGDIPVDTLNDDECIEIMTGAALPPVADTVVRYEDVEINNGSATLLTTNITQGQNLHLRGADKKQGDIIAEKGQLISPALVGIAASVGKSSLLVKKMPRVAIISSGDELVDVAIEPSAFQIRKSNSYTIKSALELHQLKADMLHIPDDLEITRQKLTECLQNYDVLLLSGGVSIGKFDYIPKALDELGVKKLFHKVQQRPGKPFWFGSDEKGVLVFAFPGNPVATFMCLHRYFFTWFENISGLTSAKKYAVLADNYTFKPELKCFLQVKLYMGDDGRLMALPLAGNGSGDFANLADTDAFMELPLEKNVFNTGEVYRIWPFK